MIESQGKSWPPARVPDSPWYDVYGASSAVGIFAVQLGHLMGYRIIALCSPHNAELVKSLGADEVVDYHDAEKASADIKRISGGGVTLGLDTISEGKSFQICLGGFGHINPEGSDKPAFDRILSHSTTRTISSPPDQTDRLTFISSQPWSISSICPLSLIGGARILYFVIRLGVRLLISTPNIPRRPGIPMASL